MNRLSNQLLSLLGTVTTIVIAVIELSDISFLEKNKRIIYFSLILIIILCFITYWLYRNKKNKNKSEIQLAVIGRVATGKSVFITVFFDSLQRAKKRNYEFLIDDKITTERVYNDIDRLSVGEWLPSTPIGGYNTDYKGLLIRNSLTQTSYNLTLTDYSGEQFQNLANEESRSWSHNERYFDYLMKSDIVFLTINVNEIDYSHYTMSDYLASINLLASVEKRKQITRPFVLMFLQSDRLGDKKEYLNEEQIKERYSNLIDVLKKRCKFFNYYFVSAIGEDAKKFIYYDGENPNHNKNIKLKPINVVEPFYWSITKLKI